MGHFHDLDDWSHGDRELLTRRKRIAAHEIACDAVQQPHCSLGRNTGHEQLGHVPIV
jgi:hypothetical protein